MAKIGRNDLCGCGSGKKYKKCCLARDQALAQQARAAAAPKTDQHGLSDERYDEMVALSNGVLELIDDGRLDEAERDARDLLGRFPEVHDGYARLGLIHELRGENSQAAAYYRKVIAFVREHSGLYDPEFADGYQDLIDRLEPAESMGALPHRH